MLLIHAAMTRFVVGSTTMAGRMVQLRVGGQTYRVTTSASDDELARLVAVVEAKLQQVAPATRPVAPQAMLLAAMSLAHDLEEEREKAAQVTERAQQALESLLERVDAVLAMTSDDSNGDGRA